MKMPSNRTLVAVGLVLLALLAVNYMVKAGFAIRSLYEDKTSSPVSIVLPQSEWQRKTIDVPQTCSTRTLQQFDIGVIPTTPPPDGEYWGCWPGYEAVAKGPRGAEKCRNVYSGKTSPPQKFKYTGNKYYGCSFDTERDIWACPQCQV